MAFERRRQGAAALATVCGAALLVWAIRAAGADAVVGGVRRLGGGFVVVFALGGIRHLVRTVAWMLCFDRRDRPGLAEAFSAYLSGDSLGNVTPFGFLISEPAKVLLIRRSVAPPLAIPALAIENILASATVVLMLIAGSAALLLLFPVPPAVRIAALATVAAAVAAGIVGIVVVTKRIPLAATLARVLVRLRIGTRWLEPRLDHVEQIESRILNFASTHQGVVLPILGLELSYHAAGVLEIWYALTAITGSAPSLLTAFVLEYVNRTITVAFQFVPMWLGVDEAGTGVVTATLGMGPAVGVTLAIVRKARVVAWTAIGITLLLRRGMSVTSTVREADAIAGKQ